MAMHGDKREQVVAWVLDRIATGELGGGDRLVTQEIANATQVSLTPVREALAELAGIGLVDLLPNRGAVIHRFSNREISGICRVRKSLECEAIRWAVTRIPSESLRQLDDLLSKLEARVKAGAKPIKQARVADTKLHELIRNHCGNPFLERELQRLSRLFRSLRDASWVQASEEPDCDRLREEVAEHREIVKELLNRDSRRARAAMAKHIRASVQYWLKTARNEPSRSFSTDA
jgi:DNA-binding GntR family transcriptional regulator